MIGFWSATYDKTKVRTTTLRRSRVKKSSLILLGVILLLLSTIIACSAFGPSSPPEPALLTYTNNTWGYSIGYPTDWEPLEESGKPVYLLPSGQYAGYVGISVLENPTLPIDEIAKRWLFAVTQNQKDVALVDTAKMEGLWNWYLSYDYVSDQGQEFHAESFFKQTGTRVYKIDTVGEKAKYAEYPFSRILASFKLPSEK